jgi:hypothetical protein
MGEFIERILEGEKIFWKRIFESNINSWIFKRKKVCWNYFEFDFDGLKLKLRFNGKVFERKSNR